MNNFNYCPTVRLSWSEVAELIGEVVQRKIMRTMKVHAHCDDSDYWSFSVLNTPFTVAEIYQLLMMVDHDDEMRLDAISSDGDTSRSIGMLLSRKLLMKAIHLDWTEELITPSALWLIDVFKTEPAITKNVIRIGRQNICLDDLKSKDELLEYFHENGPTHTALMDFCEEYRVQYGNELCWSYPISDGKHLGTFLVLIKEGILSIPYDDADKVDYELFCMDDVAMFDAEAMQVFIEDWNSFSEDLLQAMYAMRSYLKKAVKAHE